MSNIHWSKCPASRRDMLRAGLYGLGIRSALPLIFGETSLSIAAQAFAGGEAHPERTLVVVELTGGNDGLDTIIPYSNDAYRKARPTLAPSSTSVLKLNEEIAFHPKLGGLKHLWDEGCLAVVQGCGYPNPDRSHFSSMEYWHTATPYQPQTVGWVGRLADSYWPDGKPNTIVNITQKQSLAVQSQKHSPVVFSRPEEFVRAGESTQGAVYRELLADENSRNATVNFVSRIAKGASDSSQRVREAIHSYSSPIPYGSSPLSMDLQKVAALIGAGFPTRIYYVSLPGFDTHAGQVGGRQYLLTGLGESLYAFQQDLKRLGRDNDVAMMMFSEFGRRVEENASAGTDHGTAGPMFIVGKGVKAGLYGKHPSLTDLDGNGDLKMTTDFRRVYATMISEWMGYSDTKSILKNDFETLHAFSGTKA